MTENQQIQMDIIMRDIGQSIIDVGGKIYIYSLFEPSYSSSSTSVDTCFFKGIEITEFVGVVRNVANRIQIINQFQSYIANKEYWNIKFNKVIPYFLYSK